MVYWLTFAILLAYLALSWFIGTWLHPAGSGIWILRIGLGIIGAIAAASFVWFYRKAHTPSPEEQTSGTEPGDIALLVQDAIKRLKNSPVGRGASLRNLPLILMLGDAGSTKTTTIVHSALDPELLAGHAYQDTTIIPTRLANIWYTRQAVFVDPAGALASQPAQWKQLLKLIQPKRVSTALGKGQQAARAAIVCYDCENFTKLGSEASMSAARRLGVRLQEISQILGISFPVYVLFTKLDRVSFFTEYVGGLNKEEAAQVLGTTLPVRSLSSGVYAEEETKRLTKAFDELFYSLAERRLELLGSENSVEKLAGIYEFPRELRKLRNVLVQFLVDIGRPSQLNVNPFLRGFYFTGVRPVIVDEVVAAKPEMQVQDSGFDAGATRIFSGGGGLYASQAPTPARLASSRKVPQWIFLTQLFNEVILKDRVALSASRFSSQVSLFRRVVLSCAMALIVACLIALAVSFTGNRSLESKISAAAQELGTVHVRPGEVPSIDQLDKLDRLRQQLQVIATYRRDGVPLRLRWGLYVGDQIYPAARQIYFDHFGEMLFFGTQTKLLQALRSLKDKPDPSDVYETPYNDLKAYLITTSNPEKSTADFLTPVLQHHWLASKSVNEQTAELARNQFYFYSAELPSGNPYASSNDSMAIAHARSYLAEFGGIDRAYFSLLAQASRTNPDLNFNSQFRESAATISSPYTVRGAFSLGGFSFVQDAIRKPSSYSSGEEWVLGKVTASELDSASLQQKLTERYSKDFIDQWRTVLERSHVLVSQNDPAAAAAKLENLTSPSSPLLELLWFVSHNTDVGGDISQVFAPVHVVEPPGPANKLPDQWIVPSNSGYISALGKLQADINTLVRSATGLGDTSLINQATSSAEAAREAARQAIGTKVDQTLHTEKLVANLLYEPITDAERAISGGPKQALNAGGKGLCASFDDLHRYFPFNSSGPDMPSDELNAALAPKTGALWSFYDSKLSSFLVRQGNRFAPVDSGTIKITPGFVSFFNYAAALSSAFYTGGSPTPNFSYTLKELFTNVDGLSLEVSGQTINTLGQQKTFTWTGSPNEQVKATAKGNLLGSPYSGPWSIFHFVSDAHWKATGTGSYDLEWVMQANNRDILLPNGKKESYGYQLQVNGLNPLVPSELSGVRCVSTVAR